MEKYSWIKVKQENTEQGEPGSYERLRKSLHAYSLSNLIQWKRIYSYIATTTRPYVPRCQTLKVRGCREA